MRFPLALRGDENFLKKYEHIVVWIFPAWFSAALKKIWCSLHYGFLNISYIDRDIIKNDRDFDFIGLNSKTVITVIR